MNERIKKEKTCKITSISMDWATWNDIQARAWSPSSLFQFGYECKKNARSEGEITLKMREYEKKIEFFAGRLADTQKRLYEFEEKLSEVKK